MRRLLYPLVMALEIVLVSLNNYKHYVTHELDHYLQQQLQDSKHLH